MARYPYALSTTYPPTNVEELLAVPGFPDGRPPKGRFYEASIFQDRLDGHVAGHGWPYAIWTFDVLTQAMVNQLRTICPGHSAQVYLRTRHTDGSFKDYTGIMSWPSRDQMESREFGGHYLGLQFEFRMLQEVSEGEGQLLFYDSDNSGLIAAL